MSNVSGLQQARAIIEAHRSATTSEYKATPEKQRDYLSGALAAQTDLLSDVEAAIKSESVKSTIIGRAVVGYGKDSEKVEFIYLISDPLFKIWQNDFLHLVFESDGDTEGCWRLEPEVVELIEESLCIKLPDSNDYFIEGCN